MRNTIKNKKQAWWKVGCTAVAATGAAITLISIAVHLHLGNETKINKVDADKVQDVDVEGDNNKVGDTYNTYIENNYYLTDDDPSVPQETDTSEESSSVGFETETYVRLAGAADRTWRKSVEAKVGDQVEFRILYTNTSDKSQTGVAIKDILPSDLKYVAGSSVIKNSNHPNGAKIVQDALVDNGIRIGNFSKDANAYIYFTAEIVDENLSVGTNSLENWGQAGVGEITIQDFAEVIVVKE